VAPFQECERNYNLMLSIFPRMVDIRKLFWKFNAQRFFNINVKMYYGSCIVQTYHWCIFCWFHRKLCYNNCVPLSQNTTDNVVSQQLEGIMKFGGSAELEPDTPDGKLMDLDSISSTQLARHVRTIYSK